MDVARRRPLLDAMTVYKGKSKGWNSHAKLCPEVQAPVGTARQDWFLIYKTLLVLTGLRKGELASITGVKWT